MGNKKFAFNPFEGDKAVSCEEDIVFYIDDIKPEIITTVVEMYNSGSSVEAIGKYLDKADGVLLEESEYITEQISNYLKLAGDTQEETPVQVEVVTVKATKESEIGKIDPVTTEEKKIVIKGQEENPVNIPAKVDGRKNRQPRTAQVSATTKVQSPEDYLKLLEEKMLLTKTLATIQAPEIPIGVSKQGRELMLELNKEMTGMISKFMEKIQTM